MSKAFTPREPAFWELCKALGVLDSGVYGVELSAFVGEPVTVTVHRYVDKDCLADAKRVVIEHRLTIDRGEVVSSEPLVPQVDDSGTDAATSEVVDRLRSVARRAGRRLT